MTVKYIVSVSGGLGSAEALRRTIEKHGRENVVAVFCDVKGDPLVSHTWSQTPCLDALLHERYGGESRGAMRFLWQAAHALDIPIHHTQDKQRRTIWSVFVQYRALRLFTGGGFFCKASEQLKREVFYQFIQESDLKPGEYSLVFGMDWTEEHRVKSLENYWRPKLGWDVPIICPLTEAPYVQKRDVANIFEALGCEISDAYKKNYEHDNCNRICVQAGLAHYAQLYSDDRDTYLYAAWMERRWQLVTGKDNTILKDQRGGETTPLSLYDFIPRIEASDYPKLDFGGCGCFSNLPMEFLQTCEVKPVVKQEPNAPQPELVKVPQSTQLSLFAGATI